MQNSLFLSSFSSNNVNKLYDPEAYGLGLNPAYNLVQGPERQTDRQRYTIFDGHIRTMFPPQEIIFLWFKLTMQRYSYVVNLNLSIIIDCSFHQEDRKCN
jgi:hypothetical protein